MSFAEHHRGQDGDALFSLLHKAPHLAPGMKTSDGRRVWILGEYQHDVPKAVVVKQRLQLQVVLPLFLCGQRRNFVLKLLQKRLGFLGHDSLLLAPFRGQN